MEQMNEIEESYRSILALKPTPVSKFSVQNLLKQVKAMEKEVQSLREAASAKEDAKTDDEGKKKKAKGSTPTGTPRKMAAKSDVRKTPVKKTPVKK